MIRQGLCIALSCLVAAGWAYWALAWWRTRMFFRARREELRGMGGPPMSSLGDTRAVGSETATSRGMGGSPMSSLGDAHAIGSETAASRGTGGSPMSSLGDAHAIGSETAASRGMGGSPMSSMVRARHANEGEISRASMSCEERHGQDAHATDVAAVATRPSVISAGEHGQDARATELTQDAARLPVADSAEHGRAASATEIAAGKPRTSAPDSGDHGRAARATVGPGAFRPRVSILKPVKGVDAEAYANFCTFCRQDYPAYELLFAVLDSQDPVIALIHRLQAEFSHISIRLLVAAPLGANPKCANLHRLAAEAAGDVLVISDGDIRVTPDYLARVVAPLADATVGLVTCAYRGLLARSVPARLEALHMDVVFLPSVMMAHWLGERIGLGATLALRKSDLQRAGGFAAIADHLMDDYQLAVLIERLGLQTRLSHYIVGSTLGQTRFSHQWDREVRWSRGIRVTAPAKYWGLLATFPTPWAALLLAAGAMRPAFAAVFGATLALRWVAAWNVGRLLNRNPHASVGRAPSAESLSAEESRRAVLALHESSPNGDVGRDLYHRGDASNGPRRDESRPTSLAAVSWDWRNLLLLPARDAMSFAVWFAGVGGRRISWRGEEFLLLRDGRLQPARENMHSKIDVNQDKPVRAGWMDRAVRRLDRFLRDREGIFEYCDDADSIFRVSIGVFDDTVQLADGTSLAPGDAICDLHLFNEHVPPIGPDGAGMRWASQTQHLIRKALRKLAAAFIADPRFAGVKAVRAQSVLVPRRGSKQVDRLAARMHFELRDSFQRPSLFKRLHQFGENILIWALVRTFNPGGLSKAKLMRERRRMLMSREVLMGKYGARATVSAAGSAARNDSSA